jgi:hypothetical protein
VLPGVRQLHHSIFRRPRLPFNHQYEHHELHGRYGDLAFQAVDDRQYTKFVNLHPDCLCGLHQLVWHDVRWMFSLLRGLHVPDVLSSAVSDVVQS